MPILFDVEFQDEERLETVTFLSLANEPASDGILERTFVEDAIRLRDSDPEAYEFVWDLIHLAIDRGAPMDALEG